MLFVSPEAVHLDCAEEIARSCTQYRPVPGQFSLCKPYQGSLAAGRALGSGRDPPNRDPQTLGDPAPATAAHPAAEAGVAAGGTEQHRRKRRKKTPCSDAVRACREAEAQQRHAAAEGFLTAAHLLVQERMRHQAAAAEPPCSTDVFKHSGTGHAALVEREAEAAVPLDLLALAQLKHAMKPKLRLLHAPEGSAVNLFDRLVENSSDTEQLADACGTPVLLPARCRFVISDVTRLGPLLAGMPCFAVNFSVTSHPMMYLSRIIQ